MSVAAALPQSRLQTGWNKWAIVMTASLAALLQVIDTSIVNVALADMQSTLGATLSEIGWVVTSYAMANVIVIPLSAWLGLYFGSKRYFIVSLIGFTLASVLCGMATTLPMLIAARVLQGIAGGGLLTKAQSILFETFPPAEQGKAQAVFGIGVIAGPAIGPTLGGYLTTNFSWPWIFYVNLPVGIAAVLMAIAYFPEDKGGRKISAKVDWLGIFLLIVSIGSLQWMLEEGNANDWFEDKFILGLAVTAVIGSILFVWRELKVDHPAVDLRVLRHRSVAAGSMFSAVLGMGLFGALFAIPIFAQVMLGYTAMQTGMLLLPGALASAVMMPVMGKLTSKVDNRILIVIGALTVVGTMYAFRSMNPQTNVDDLFWPLIFRGAGTVMMFLPLSLATLGPVPKKDVPAASGFYNLTRQMGGSIGIAVLTTILAQREGFHRAILTESFSQYNPLALERIQQYTAGLMARGMDQTTARLQALKLMDMNMSAQAMVMSFGDIFYVVAIVFLVSLPLVFFLSRGKSGSAPPTAEH